MPPRRSPLRKLKESLRSLRDRHEVRRRPSGFGFAFADRVDYLDRSEWDQLNAAGSLFLRRDVLRVLEEHGPENIEPRYAMIFRDRRPVALLAAQLVTVTGAQLAPVPGSGVESPAAGSGQAGGTGKNAAAVTVRDGDKATRRRGLLRRALAPAAQIARANLRERILVAGNLLSWGFHGITFAPDEDPAALWPAVAEALYRIRRAERLAGQTDFVMVKDLTAGQGGVERLREFSYRPLETEPNMVLPVDASWRSYDDYLGALDARYRRNSRDQIKKLGAAGCTVEPLLNLDADAERLHELYLAVQRNAPVRLVTLPPSCLPALARAWGADFRCNVVRRGGEILGFVTSLRDGPTAIAYYIGFDRAAAAEGLPIYLRLLHSTIGDAIGWGCDRLSLGRTALEPKAALGAKPERMSVWLRHRVPAMNWMLRGVLGAVPHQEAPERNPFKAPPAGPGGSA